MQRELRDLRASVSVSARGNREKLRNTSKNTRGRLSQLPERFLLTQEISKLFDSLSKYQTSWHSCTKGGLEFLQFAKNTKSGSDDSIVEDEWKKSLNQFQKNDQ